MRLPLDSLIKALQAEGCRVTSPRYPLLHQQPFFTEGHFRRIARLPSSIDAPSYAPDALPRTERESLGLMRLPAFPSADRVILDQYIDAFRKVIEHADAILAA